jgi:hypothetical protein
VTKPYSGRRAGSEEGKVDERMSRFDFVVGRDLDQLRTPA